MISRVRTGIDSWVNSAASSSNYGGGKWLRCLAPGTGTKNSFLFFKNPAPRGATISAATLRLFEVGSFGTSVTVSVQRVSAKWTESLIDYDNQPGVTGSVVSVTQTSSADAAEWAFDVAALLQTMTDGAANYGFRITTTSTTERRFYSLNAADNRPVLVVEWSDPPEAPTELSPSGGSAVSVAKPIVTFNYTDVSSDALAACQVQINSTSTMTSPDFDSGTVATSDPELDLSATAFSGITAGTTKYWRVRVQNAVGLWSDWSDVVHFTRVAHLSVTLNSPGASPNNYVEDHTPELSWTVTGGTQLSRRIIISDDDDPTNPLLDTGRQTTAATTYTPPKGVITDEGVTYRLELRTHDEQTRVQTPGDPVYVQTVRAFTFQEDATIDPVTSLVAAQDGERPHVALTWNRATFPDGYTINRNGVEVQHDLDPADLFVSGTSFRYVDRTAQPHGSHTWKVRCRVNGKLGPGPTITYSYETPVWWLADWDHPGSTRLVPIIVTAGDTTAFDMPETSAVYVPINGKASIPVREGKRGLEGSATGRIIDYAGITAANASNDFLWMIARPENTLRLTIGAQNLRVVLRNGVLLPLAGGNADDRAVSFEFYSLDGPTRQ